MVVAAAVLRTLRPSVQVSTGNACAFAGTAAIAMHLVGTASLSKAAVPVGVLLTGVAALGAMLALFTRLTDAHRARVQAVLGPPLVGALVGMLIDGGIRAANPTMRIGFAGIALGGGLAEFVAVAVLSAMVGLVGVAIVLPQVNALACTREGDAQGGPHSAHAAGSLALRAWVTALGIGLLGLMWGDSRGPSLAVVVLGALGLASHLVRERFARAGRVAFPAPLPYR